VPKICSEEKLTLKRLKTKIRKSWTMINSKKPKTLISTSKTNPNTEIDPVIVEAKSSLRNAVYPKRSFSKKNRKRKD
jgi:hypothetical protein